MKKIILQGQLEIIYSFVRKVATFIGKSVKMTKM